VDDIIEANKRLENPPMSTGAKVGIAFSVIGVFIVGGIAGYCFCKRKGNE
jgi:LPXTG-motif cell wall-anchored protein